MVINQEIECLYKIVTNYNSNSILGMGTFDKMFALSIISAFNHINIGLEKLNDELEISIKLEGVSFNFEKYTNLDNWVKSNILFADKNKIFKNVGVDLNDISYKHEINHFTDYLPPVDNEKGFKQAQVDSFKTAMHQFCDEEKLSSQDIRYGLFHGVVTMTELLKQIKEKVKNPKKHQYRKVWDEVSEEYKNTDSDKEYSEWKDECGEIKFEDLQARQKLEIFNLISSGFFRHYSNPTGAEVKRCRLTISEDDLPMGIQIPENTNVECTKLTKFVEWRGESILVINYEKLGYYIYHCYKNLKKIDLCNIVYFDQMLDLIHEDMAKLRPHIAKYLKRYEENQIYELSLDCKKIINCCKPFLKSDINDSLLSAYIDKIMFDPEIKEEARSKLAGQSKNKYICEMIAHLYNGNVFDVKYNADDFAKVLREELSLGENTVKRYINEIINSRNGALYTWTKNHIDELLSTENKIAG